jgi:hypothetical protein
MKLSNGSEKRIALRVSGVISARVPIGYDRNSSSSFGFTKVSKIQGPTSA